MAECSANLYIYIHVCVCMSCSAKPCSCWVKFWQFGRHRALGLVTRGHLHINLSLFIKPKKRSVTGFYFGEQSMKIFIYAEKVKPFSPKLKVC